MAIDFQDNFKVIRKIQITGEDLVALSQLYLPLMGIDSYSIYLVFSTFPEKEAAPFKRLLDILSMPSMKTITHALEKLEAIGLLKTYVNKENTYLFEMVYPLGCSSFFNSRILSEYLAGQVGIVEYEKLKDRFIRKPVKGYSEITKSFDEVYQTSTSGINDIYKTLIESKNFNPIKIKEIDFDYLLFKMNFNEDFIGEDVLETNEFKKTILEIAHTYHLNEEEMKDVVINTINFDKELTFDYLSKNARNVYRKKSNADAVHLETKSEDSFVASSLDDDTYKLINYCENASFADVLKMLSGITPAQSELRMFDELKNNTHFSNGVINMMILYVSNTLNGEIPGYNYFEKIANSWARAGIKTSIDVSNYLLKRQTPTQQKSYSRVAPTPEWYDDYVKEVANSKKTTNITEEDLEKALQEAESIFKKEE